MQVCSSVCVLTFMIRDRELSARDDVFYFKIIALMFIPGSDDATVCGRLFHSEFRGKREIMVPIICGSVWDHAFLYIFIGNF